MFHNILDVSAYNAFVLWRELRSQWMRDKLYRRRVFLEQLGKALVTPLIERQRCLPRTEASAALVKATTSRAAAAGVRGKVDNGDSDHDAEPTAPRVASRRKRCQLCQKTKDRKTYTVCGACKRYICGRCTRTARASSLLAIARRRFELRLYAAQKKINKILHHDVDFQLQQGVPGDPEG